MMTRRLLALVLVLTAAACAHYPVNPPLATVDPSHGYRYADLTLPRHDGTFVILTFSGGGARAAGFAYGVLRQMQETPMPGGRTMLDYIDVISSVSGGSFTAMQYGLHGAEGLDSLKKDFLDQNIEGMLFKAAFLTPSNWLRLLSPSFHRIDLAQELYDAQLFHNADYAALQEAQKKGRPLIIANSTELEIGSRFEWTQDQFDAICSDLTPVRVSRAVASSSAFPGLLTPLVVNSYTNRCGYQVPPWVPNAGQDQAVNPSRTRMAAELMSYTNPQRQYLHLMDGGIADNIGLRGPLHAITSTDTYVAPAPTDPTRTGFTILPLLNRGEIKKLLFIVVTAEPSSKSTVIDAHARLPNIVQVLGTVINTPMGNYSFDTIQLLRQTLQNKEVAQKTPAQCQELGRKTCPDFTVRGANQAQVGYYGAVVSFPLVSDKELRNRLNQIGTNFALKPGQLDDLVAGAKDVLANAEEYQKFISEVRAGTP